MDDHTPYIPIYYVLTIAHMFAQVHKLAVLHKFHCTWKRLKCIQWTSTMQTQHHKIIPATLPTELAGMNTQNPLLHLTPRWKALGALRHLDNKSGRFPAWSRNPWMVIWFTLFTPIDCVVRSHICTSFARSPSPGVQFLFLGTPRAEIMLVALCRFIKLLFSFEIVIKVSSCWSKGSSYIPAPELLQSSPSFLVG